MIGSMRIVLGRKPISEKTVAENCLKWGVGGINIDGCRVGTDDKPRVGNAERSNSVGYGVATWQKSETTPPLGRWPANVILSYPDDEYGLRDNVTPKQLNELARWLDENA